MKVRLKHERLADELARSRLTQNRWAQKMGLGRGHLSNLVNGRILYPRAATREKLLRALGVPFEELFQVEYPESRRETVEGMVVDSNKAPPRSATGRPAEPPREELIMNWVTEFRHGVRCLSRQRAFAAVAILTLALGIGANSAIFSIVNAVLLRPLPYPEPDRLVVPATVGSQGDRGPVSYPDYLQWKERKHLFEQVALVSERGADLTGEGDPQRITILAVSEDYLPMMEATPLVGRLFQAEEFSEGNDQVALLSQGFWLEHFGGSPDVVGETIRLSDRAHIVVGVIRDELVYPPEARLLVPFAVPRPIPGYMQRWDNFFLRAVARLARGVRLESADAAVKTLASQVEERFPVKRKGVSARLVPLRNWVAGENLRLGLAVLLGAVGLVLLIACVNLANLMLARSLERAREMAVRMTLGAGRFQIFRQLLAESLVVSLLGGLSGLLLAYWGLGGLLTWAPDGVPRLQETRIDGTVLLFTLALTVLTAVVFGMIPALRATRSEPAEALREFGRTLSGGRGIARLRAILVGGEIALSLLLLVAAGLLVRSLLTIYENDPGIRISQVLTARVNLPNSRYQTKTSSDAFFDRLLERLDQNPSIQSAAACSVLPLGGGGINLRRAHLEEGMPEPPDGPEFDAAWAAVTPGYFQTLGIGLKRGRYFNPRDRSDSTPVMIVNRAFAELVFDGRDPIGKRIRSWRDENVYREVVGVVGNVLVGGLDEPARPMVYVPSKQAGYPSLQAIIAYTRTSPDTVADSVREAIWTVDPKLPIREMITMDRIAADSVRVRQFLIFLLTTFAGVALILAAIGIYGVVSYSVAQRTQEIGLRMALGARQRDVLRLILGEGLRLTLVGGVIGLAAALAVSQVLKNLLFGVSVMDPASYAGAAVMLVCTALVSSLIPAKRASSVNPTEALREE